MGIKLLLADDSITIQKVVGIIFSGAEYELTVVDDGTSAIERAREILPDLMLVDALMPGKNGYEVCQAIRQEPSLSHLPLLLLTGAFEPFDEEKARQCGADDFITKPFESQQLMEKVGALLSLAKDRPSSAAPPPITPIEAPAPMADEWAAVAPSPIDAPLQEPVPTMPEFETVPFDTFESGSVPDAPVDALSAQPASDDLWGAFEMEAEPTAGVDSVPGDFGAGNDLAPPMGEGFESQTLQGDVWGTVAEEPPQVEAFGAEPVSGFIQEPMGGVADDASAAFAVEPEPAPESFAALMAEPVAPAPVTEVEGGAPGAQVQGAVTLSDAQLNELVARISRDVIERIAWEVVPDLAESIIKDEIRKIREGR